MTMNRTVKHWILSAEILVLCMLAAAPSALIALSVFAGMAHSHRTGSPVAVVALGNDSPSLRTTFDGPPWN
jgi:hypothetical protein